MSYGVHVTRLTGEEVAGAVVVEEVEVFQHETAEDRFAHRVQCVLGTILEEHRERKADQAAQQCKTNQKEQKVLK